MRSIGTILGIFSMSGFLLASSLPAEAGIFLSAEKRIERIDLNERQTMERLLASDAKAKRLYERAFGYAVFNVTKAALLLTGAGGSGVAVDAMTAKRTYMHVGMGGIGLGIGGQASRMVLLFEDKVTFDDFVSNEWQARSSANAVAGRVGINADAVFTNGVAIYQLTDAGLLLQADISTAHFWQSRRLNGWTTIRTAQDILPEN